MGAKQYRDKTVDKSKSNSTLNSEVEVFTDRQGLKGGGAFNLKKKDYEEFEKRKDGWRPSDQELKTKFDQNKKKYLKDLSKIEKGWDTKMDLAEALVIEL